MTQKSLRKWACRYITANNLIDVLKADAEIAGNDRIYNYYSDNSGHYDVWINFSALVDDGFDGFIKEHLAPYFYNEVQMLRFYDVDQDYVEYLRQFEPKVPYIKYDGKDKFVCGIVLNINSCDYFVPVSSNTTKHQYDIIIKDDNNTAISSLRFNYMFPAPIEILTEKNINAIRQTDPAYASLLQKEYQFCRNHESEIMAKAQKVYRIGCNPNHFLYQYCCDFRLLEAKRKDYFLQLMRKWMP